MRKMMVGLAWGNWGKNICAQKESGNTVRGGAVGAPSPQSSRVREKSSNIGGSHSCPSDPGGGLRKGS